MTTLPATRTRPQGRAAQRRSTCPVACTLDIVGDRWTLLVIRDLLGGKSRFNDLLASPENIPSNILAERLKRLEREGLVQTVPYSKRPLRNDYYLSREGRALGRTLAVLADWGEAHFHGTARAAWARRRPNPSAASATSVEPVGASSETWAISDGDAVL